MLEGKLDLRSFVTALGILIALPAAAQNTSDGVPPDDVTGQPALKQGRSLPSEARRNEAETAEAVRQWNLGNLKGGWLGSQLMGAEVVGRDGGEIGQVRNILVGQDARIDGIIVETGGFLGFGENHLRVAWKDMTLLPGLTQVSIPVSEDNVDEFSLFGRDEAADVRPFRFTELTQAYATLGDDEGYGFVDDLLFAQNGRLLAVVTQPTGGFEGGKSHFAFPYDAEAYDRRRGAWRFPFSRGEVAVMEPFQLGRPGADR